jgi:hypothetical protein
MRPDEIDALGSVIEAGRTLRRIQFALDGEFHLTEFVADIGRVGPGPVNRVVAKPWNDVPVAMIDGLAGGVAIVDDHIQAVSPGGRADGSAQPGQKRADGGGYSLRELAEMSVMSLGHEQSVAAIDRIDVEEGHGFGRLEYFSRRDRAVSDLAEHAVWIVRSMAQRSHRFAVVLETMEI